MTPRELVASHLPLVRAIAAGVKRSTLTGADMDDLISWGTLGLCEAAERFDATRGAAFSTFAFRRIQGAMVDGARQELGGGKAYASLTRVSMEQVSERAAEVWSPEEDVDRGRQIQVMRGALEEMPEGERDLVVGVEARGETLEEVGERLGHGRSWACKARARAIGELRRRCVSRPMAMVQRPVAPVAPVVQVAPVVAPAPVVPMSTQAGAVRQLRMVGVRGRSPYRGAVLSLLCRAPIPSPGLFPAEFSPGPAHRRPAVVQRSAVVLRAGAPPGRGGERAGPWPGWGPGERAVEGRVGS